MARGLGELLQVTREGNPGAWAVAWGPLGTGMAWQGMVWQVWQHVVHGMAMGMGVGWHGVVWQGRAAVAWQLLQAQGTRRAGQASCCMLNQAACSAEAVHVLGQLCTATCLTLCFRCATDQTAYRACKRS